MHPIEHLRYVARSSRVDPDEMVREAAIALGSLRGNGPDLVIACRRIVERHPQAGQLWWLCARLLTSAEPSRLAWELADAVEHDPTPLALANSLPDEATVVTVGYPAVVCAALERRGDVRVLAVDSRHAASAFVRHLELVDVECDPVPSEAIARAVVAADVVLIDVTAASRERVIAPIGGHVVAAVAASVGVPVWCVAGLGRRLPVEFVDAIADRIAGEGPAWDLDHDDVPVGLFTSVVTGDGLSADRDVALRAECAFTPELLRTSPI